VDILINDAGFLMHGAVEDTSMGDARYQFEVNLFGLARPTQSVLPHMREQRAGKIANISSMDGKIQTPLGAWYHATKHALEGWRDCLRIELKPFNIGVSVVEPGLIATEFGANVADDFLERSGEGPYRKMAQAMAQAPSSSNDDGSAAGSPPLVIVEVISNAIAAARPRTRYVAGRMARPLMLIRSIFGDRIYERPTMPQLAQRDSLAPADRG
jgi:short-subunit dehydrogenase